MKKEISAGGVIIRKKNQQWEVLLLKDMNGNWTFPKGLIESGEEPQQAAIREIQEETGVTDLNILSNLSTIHYMYQRNGLIDKTVYYFLFKSEGNDSLIPQTEEGISELRWTELKEAQSIIGYPKTNVPLLIEAQQNITSSQT